MTSEIDIKKHRELFLYHLANAKRAEEVGARQSEASSTRLAAEQGAILTAAILLLERHP